MISNYMAKMDWWALFGLAAQMAFSARFIIQWIASEQAKKSVIPISFWYLSIVGSVGLLIYAHARENPVFLLGYLFNSGIYIRNLVFVYRERGAATGASA